MGGKAHFRTSSDHLEPHPLFLKWEHELTAVFFLTLHPSVNVIQLYYSKGWALHISNL